MCISRAVFKGGDISDADRPWNLSVKILPGPGLGPPPQFPYCPEEGALRFEADGPPERKCQWMAFSVHMPASMLCCTFTHIYLHCVGVG